MTVTEIALRLRDEFPDDRRVTFTLEVDKKRSGEYSVEMTIWEREAGFIPCASFGEGIRALKSKLGQLEPQIEVEV